MFKTIIYLTINFLFAISIMAGTPTSKLFKKEKPDYRSANPDKPYFIIGFNGYFHKYKLEWYDENILEDQTMRLWPFASLLYPVSKNKSLILNLQIYDAPFKMDYAQQYNFTVTFSCGIKIYLNNNDNQQ